MNIIKKTDVHFEPGTKLNVDDLNKISTTLDAVIDNVNAIVLSCFDVNLELGDYNRTFTLSEAISIISSIRRQLGMRIRFKVEGGLVAEVAEYYYIGETVADSNFSNTDNWVTTTPSIIDGGMFD